MNRSHLVLLSAVLLSCSKSAPPAPAPVRDAVTPTTVEVRNTTGSPITVYFAFGSDSKVLPSDWPFCQGSGLVCSFQLGANSPQALPAAGYLNTTISFGMPVSCGATKVELNVNNPSWYDTYDISLVDGFNAKVAVDVIESTGKKTLGPVLGKDGNEKAYGVFPYGCDICTARENPPCGIPKGKEGCKGGSQYKPDVICQVQGAQKTGGSAVTVSLLE